MKFKFIDKKFKPESLRLIGIAEQIATEYTRRGYDLTLRQLYYQMVARGHIPNNERSYKSLGGFLNDARLAGIFNWNYINDRTRYVREPLVWTEIDEIISSAASSYRQNLWEGQENYVEVWVEKDALVGIVEQACDKYRVPYFSCRGYVSQSEMYQASIRFGTKMNDGMRPVLIHLGDHDPSGIDMTRDIQDRLDLFLGTGEVLVDRIALTMDQVDEYTPPPNPAKTTDSRFESYIGLYGDESWELDALDPTTIEDLITERVETYMDMNRYEAQVALEREEPEILRVISRNWEEIREHIEETYM